MVQLFLDKVAVFIDCSIDMLYSGVDQFKDFGVHAIHWA